MTEPLDARIAAYLASPKFVAGWIREVDNPYLPLLREAAERLSRVRFIGEQWRAMVATAYTEGPIPHDEQGHVGRWTAVEMCADELARALAEPQP